MTKENTGVAELTPEIMKLADPLTKLQRATVINLVTGKMSQRQAYRAAGGTAKTDETADAVVSRMLSDEKVKAFHDALIGAAAKTAVMTREEALQRLTAIARTSAKDLANFRRVQVGEEEDGSPVYQTVWEFKNAGDLPDDMAGAVTEVGTGRDGLKFKVVGQAAAIKQLADMEGWNAASKHELTGKDGAPIRLEAKIDAPEIAAAIKEVLQFL